MSPLYCYSLRCDPRSARSCLVSFPHHSSQPCLPLPMHAAQTNTKCTQSDGLVRAEGGNLSSRKHVVSRSDWFTTTSELRGRSLRAEGMKEWRRRRMKRRKNPEMTLMWLTDWDWCSATSSRIPTTSGQSKEEEEPRNEQCSRMQDWQMDEKKDWRNLSNCVAPASCRVSGVLLKSTRKAAVRIQYRYVATFYAVSFKFFERILVLPSSVRFSGALNKTVPKTGSLDESLETWHLSVSLRTV